MKFGVFETSFKSLDHKMRFEERKILFTDNITSHTDTSLSDIKLQFFPSKMTPILQPMNQTINTIQ